MLKLMCALFPVLLSLILCGCDSPQSGSVTFDQTSRREEPFSRVQRLMGSNDFRHARVWYEVDASYTGASYSRRPDGSLEVQVHSAGKPKSLPVEVTGEVRDETYPIDVYYFTRDGHEVGKLVIQ